VVAIPLAVFLRTLIQSDPRTDRRLARACPCKEFADASRPPTPSRTGWQAGRAVSPLY